MKTSIAIITLNPASEDVQELVSLLASQGLTGTLVEGVDGRNEFPTLIDGERIDQNRSLKRQLVELTKSEVGCYLSHFRTIKNAYDRGLGRICILEDDVLIEPGFKEVLASIEKLPDEFEHVRLMGLKLHRRKNVCEIGENHMLTRPVKGLCGAQGYVLNRSGMEKILRHGSTISEPIDKFFDHFWDIDLKCYCVEPHVIWERTITKSTIVKICKHDATRSFPKFLRKHILKIRRGFKRRVYILRNLTGFLFAKKPEIAMGRTARIR